MTGQSDEHWHMKASTCYGSGCNFHSIQGCFADKRLRGDRCLAFISELRQKGMGEHCQGFETQRAQEFASNGAKPLVCLAPRVIIILSKTKSLTCAGLSAPDGQSCDLERRATTCLNSWSSRCNKSKTKPRSSLEPMLCIQLAGEVGVSIEHAGGGNQHMRPQVHGRTTCL